MSKKVFESKVIYENKVPPFDYEKAKEEAETIELPPDYKRPFDTPEEMEEWAAKDLTFRPLPQRAKVAKQFVNKAIEISEQYEIETVIQEFIDHYSVSYYFDYCPFGRFLKGLILFADEIDIMSDVNGYKICLTLEYYFQARLRKGKQIRP